MNLRRKLLLFFLLVLIIPIVLILLVSSSVVFNDARARTLKLMQRDLKLAQAVYENKLDDLAFRLLQTANMSIGEAYRNYYYNKKTEPLAAELESLQKEWRTTFITVIDTVERVVIRSEGEFQGDLFPLRSISRDALYGSLVRSTELIPLEDLAREAPEGKFKLGGGEGRFVSSVEAMVQVVACPLYDEAKEAIIGAVIAGRVINGTTEIVDQIRVQTGTDAAIIGNERYVATTLLGSDGSREMESPVPAKIIDRIKAENFARLRLWIGKEWRWCSFLPITNKVGRTIGVLSIFTSEREFTSITNKNIMVIILGAAGGTLIAFILSFIATAHLTSALKKLVEGAHSLGEGRLDHVVEVKTGDEVEELAREFNRMAEKLKDSYASLEQKARVKAEELAQSEKLYQDLVNNLDDVIFALDQNACFTQISMGAKRTFGYNPGEWIGRRFSDLFVSETAHIPIEIFNRELHGESESDRFKFKIYDSAGKERDVQVYSSVIRYGAEIVGVRGVARDVTAQEEFTRKEAEYAADLEREVKKRTEELEAKQQELIRANIELERLNQMKLEFLSMVSHELNTPLTTVQGYISHILSGKAGPLTERQVKGLEISQNKIDHLANLIKDLLDLTRIESGRYRLNLEDVNASFIVSDCVHSFEPLASSKGIKLENHITLPHLYLRADSVRLTQVFTNLLGNAIKFTPSNGKIKVSCKKEREGLTFSVADTGVGISEQDLRYVLEPFYQVDGSSRRRYGGLGLGLTITKEIVELHGGRIWIQSKLGEGTQVFFFLPYKPKEEIAGVPHAQRLKPVERGGRVISPEKYTVLVVDDDPDTLDFTKMILESEHFRVLTAPDGPRCLELVYREKIDIIVLDMLMPGMDGFEAGRMIRASERGKKVPIIMFTALKQEEMVMRGFKEFANEYVGKPFKPRELIDKVFNLLHVNAQKP
ncbi:MAG: ATP-binding protein [Candidatus Omnitrophica bacterium]|nr:ATP-binding protein [Candidatus Omnitrophota bacterium]